MKPISGLSYLYLSTFSKPACDRIVYRAIRRNKVASILEIGLGNANRAANMICVAKKFSGAGSVRYTGLDLFEADSNAPVSFKQCHQRLSRLGAKLQLVPGEFAGSVPRIANTHLRTDLLLISSICNNEMLDEIWFYLPRMLHAASVVFLQQAGSDQGPMEQLGRLEIERRIKQKPNRQSKAA